MKQKLILLIPVLFLLIPFIVVADSGVWILQGAEYILQDTFIQQNVPATNFGSAAYLQSMALTGIDGWTYQMIDLINFSNNTIITNATLYMLHSEKTDVFTNLMHEVWGNQTFDESVVTWNTQNLCDTSFSDASKCNLTAEGSSVYVAVGSWNKFEGTSMFQRHVREGNSNLSVSVRPIAFDLVTEIRWFSEDDGTTANMWYWNVTWENETIPDTTPPIFDTNSTNITTIRINDWVNFSMNVSDGTAVSTIIFGINDSGTMLNVSNITLSTDTIKIVNVTFNHTILAIRGKHVGYQFCANDTLDNWACSQMLNFTVANTPPTQPNMANASGVEFDVNQTFNITPSTDAESDTLTYFWFLNSTLDPIPNPVLSGITETSWTTNLTLTDNYYIFVNVSDGFVNVTGDIFNFFLHIESPTIVSTGINNSAP